MNFDTHIKEMIRKKIRKAFIEMLICIGFVLIVAFLLVYFIEPVEQVFWSVSEDKCIKVLKIENGKEVLYDCSNLPEKYERIWVK